MIPSVKPITAMSSGTFKFNFLAVLMAVTANNSLTAKTESTLLFEINFSICSAQFSMSSIFTIKFSSMAIPLSLKAF